MHERRGGTTQRTAARDSPLSHPGSVQATGCVDAPS